MAKAREEIILPIDWEFIDAANGFNFDMGGSVMKLVYVDKDDWVEPDKRKKGSKGKVRLVNFARPELEEAFKFMNKNVRFNRKDAGQTLDIFSTGFGGSQYSDEFKEKFNVKNVMLDEFGCFQHGFLYVLKNYPRKDVLHPVHEPAFKAIKAEIQTLIKMFGMAQSGPFTPHKKLEDFKFPQLEKNREDKAIADDKNFFPCAIMMCGSGFGFSTINADGTTHLVDGSGFGGKSFLALASLLTNAKDYNEIMELCCKGDANKVSTTNEIVSKQILASKSTDESDIYASWASKSDDALSDQVVFCFGQADTKKISDFKREDIARCLLETMCLNLAQVTYAAAKLQGVKHVFFCGGFINHPLVRKVLTMEWLRRECIFSLISTEKYEPIQAHFLLHAQSLGALGAMVNHKAKWFQPTTTKGEGSVQQSTSASDYKSAIGL